ncbi:MAG: Sjogren's syndrome/scleroderma autoantigen 1 family protein, partial [Thermococcus sp.]
MSISDEEIRKIIMPLMLSGAKMLDRHCPKCGSPLFEKDGKVFCPVCEH